MTDIDDQPNPFPHGDFEIADPSDDELISELASLGLAEFAEQVEGFLVANIPDSIDLVPGDREEPDPPIPGQVDLDGNVHEGDRGGE